MKADEGLQGSPGSVGRLDLVRVSSVRPEEQQPVKFGLDVGELGFAFRKYPEKASVFLQGDTYAAAELVLKPRGRPEQVTNQDT